MRNWGAIQTSQRSTKKARLQTTGLSTFWQFRSKLGQLHVFSSVARPAAPQTPYGLSVPGAGPPDVPPVTFWNGAD